MAFSFLPREDEYFTLFVQITEMIESASALLVQMLDDKPENFEAFSAKDLDCRTSRITDLS